MDISLSRNEFEILLKIVEDRVKSDENNWNSIKSAYLFGRASEKDWNNGLELYCDGSMAVTEKAP